MEPLPVSVHVRGVPLSGLVLPVPEPRATIVAVHGALARSAYFHGRAHPDQSLFALAARLGHTVVAVDRPGYGASSEHVRGRSLDERSTIYREAVETVLAEHGGNAPRVVVSHSAGAVQAARLVTGGLDGVAGWEMGSFGAEPTEIEMRPADGSGPRDPVSGRPVRELIWAADSLYPEGRRDTGARRSDSIRHEEGDAAAWTTDLPGLAARVAVPVRLTIGALDGMWPHTPEVMAHLARLFENAPRVVTNVQPGAPHNISLAWAARPYHLGVLAFAEECLLDQGVPARAISSTNSAAALASGPVPGRAS